MCGIDMEFPSFLLFVRLSHQTLMETIAPVVRLFHHVVGTPL